jgi:hypothetical protein
LKQRLSRRNYARAATLLVLVASLALAAVAMGGPTRDAQLPGAELPTATTVFISAQGGRLHFIAPKTIESGEDLTVVNQTNPKQVGPHTFALVTKGSIPKTKKARQLCFTPHHICKAIASWHGVKGNGPPTENPATAGAEGWDTLGSLTKKGDSWFTGEKPGASIDQKVTAAAGTTIYFMCAIHPWMHGQIEVLPPAGT